MLNPNSSSTSCSIGQGSQQLKGHKVSRAAPFHLLSYLNVGEGSSSVDKLIEEEFDLDKIPVYP